MKKEKLKEVVTKIATVLKAAEKTKEELEKEKGVK